ncbi:hypothetical protein C0991_000290, partial [Blastosporella zonata]
GIIRCFKAHYCSRFIQRSIRRYDSGVTPGEIYNINQLEGMRLADAAWAAVDATTIRHCWRKAGILPEADQPATQPVIPVTSLLNSIAHEQDPVEMLEKEVENALDDLEATGALQRANRMAIEDILNPIKEINCEFESSDEDICRAVLDTRKA